MRAYGQNRQEAVAGAEAAGAAVSWRQVAGCYNLPVGVDLEMAYCY